MQALSCLTFPEYLELELDSPIRHEYVGGQIFAMSGASEEHNAIALNIGARLRYHLRGTNCRAFVSDMKLSIAEADHATYYPDVMVVCSRQDRDRYFKTQPCLIVEVLSPTTAAIDKREKLLNYQKLASLQEYILISQTEAKVEAYRKDESGNWYLQTVTQGGLEFSSVNLTMSLAEVYEDVISI
jgi:Uma2 family endonuclease